MIHGDILGERARLSPESTALLYVPTQQRFTYRELNDRAIRCARLWFDQCRLVKGDRVGIATNTFRPKKNGSPQSK